MADEKKRVSFGPDYQYDSNKTLEENWAAMKAFYAKRGIEVEDLSEEKKKELDEFFESIKPDLVKYLDGIK